MQLRTIFDQIVKFEHLQKDIYDQSCAELKARQLYQDEINEAEKKVLLFLLCFVAEKKA